MKELIKQRLRKILDSNSFHEFYTGIWEKEVAGDFERNSLEDATNKAQIDKFLDSIAKQLLE